MPFLVFLHLLFICESVYVSVCVCVRVCVCVYVYCQCFGILLRIVCGFSCLTLLIFHCYGAADVH